uniref:CRK SH3-binding GNRP n=1 Tax=Lepeophtheirus salmonis TaxID=72036 RepID=A0A0K2TJ71_LEPSM
MSYLQLDQRVFIKLFFHLRIFIIFLGKTFNILNFKSTDLAEQMTYLDYQLFIRLDTVELILWVQEQNEDKSYNLTKFTEHFNNMSFWCRTQILQQDDSKEREKYMTKFIKIMKFLRKYNNFNSYLAILSALDSAPIRRLEWHKNIIDNLKEYCSLIDSSSSFRAYRQALNESGSPCIPYVGLILQDLTFVHIGNSDIYHGKINFAKRWQQFNILDNLRRFRKENYHFKRREDIISFFDGFSLYLSEDELWQLSESIKPRCSNYPKVNKQ